MKRQTIARLILCSLVAAASAATMETAAAASDSQSDRVGLPEKEAIPTVPLGGLAGGAQSNVASTINNPEESDVEAGRMLFVKLNCADCHAFNGKGSMGPSLVDKYWRYGGTPAAIYKSIFDGRPKGMPAWGVALPPKDIWQLVAYIQSLGGADPPDFYQHALQGDQEGELVAPELNFEQEINGSPRYETTSGAKSSEQTTQQK